MSERAAAEGPERSQVAFEVDGERWELVTESTGDGRLAVEVLGSDRDGEILTRLEGEVPADDLARVGRLFLEAAAHGAVDADNETHRSLAAHMERERRRHPNAYAPWTEEDDARLVARANEGASVTELMAEFGRGRGAIRSRMLKVLLPQVR
ncbi:hypothetical protein [Nocardiopsis sp. Huas11]|uniref:hypothetical protein n=1 Tax=Nocardiopsis sp. Huas11 TaxID=2183912 RepID=UPI0011C3E19C|nr:hypothetical protein [Nocardiopsis sp. Huas11]